jgi:hypothetical protein
MPLLSALLRNLLPLSVVLLAACDLGDGRDFRHDGKRGDDTSETDADADGDADGDADADADTDGDADPPGVFDEPGDIVDYESEDGTASIDLSDASGDSNKDQEFYLVLINSGSSSLGYRLWYKYMADASSGPEAPPSPAAPPRETRPRREYRPPPPSSTSPYDLSDIGVTLDEFFVRDNMDNADSYTVVVATLYALGSGISIWVDTDVPIDWDQDGDGNISPSEEHEYDSYGFDNNDLQEIAHIVDDNILPNLNAIYGALSDVNEDGMVTVLITPVLNRLPITSEDEDDWISVVASYADPDVDLQDFDAETNPGSDEQEILYIFAPDPYGYYNPFYRIDVDEYTGVSLAANIAQGVEHLISYNQHVIEHGGAAEESWVDAGLGALAADLTGFGSVNFDEAWDYLDAPYHYALTSWSDTGEVVSTEPKGAQYLFFRWLTDTYGIEVVSYLLQTSDTGIDNIKAAVASMGGDADMDELVLQWQIALLTSGVLKVDETPLVDTSVWPPFAEASLIDAPPDAPGDYYGANGYQIGINVRGENVAMSGGNTSEPEEIEAQRVRMENTDHHTYTPGFPFYGHVVGSYGAHVVRLTDVSYRRTLVEIQANSPDYYGAIVRWNDLVEEDLAVENIFSTTDSNAIRLPRIPATCEPVYGIGALSAPGASSIVLSGTTASTAVTESVWVDDVDRWRIDLSDRPLGEQVTLAIWLDRHFEDENGDAAPYDPWMAVFPEDWVPTPTYADTARAMCPATDGLYFEYPNTVLDYLYYQVFLADNPLDEDDGQTWSEYDACGELSEEATSCANDWDGDGVPDEDEPRPETFFQQVMTHLCVPSTGETPVLDRTAFDADTLDEDSNAYVDRAENVGGVSVDSGEEAFLLITLEGGDTYLLIVGGNGTTGTYELSLRQIGC